jgi:AhpC/TSA family
LSEERPPGLAGRRTLGPRPRPGGRYTLAVGLLFLAIVFVSVYSTVTNESRGIIGLQTEESLLPLPEFAAPLANGKVEGDANVYQDDCSSSTLPCPAGDRRKPACAVRGPGIVTVCDYFGRPLVISFWFTRGGECEAQQDVVNAVARRYRGRVGFLSINVRDDRDTVRDLIRERGWTIPVGYDSDGAVARLYRVGGCPTFVYAFPGGLLQDASIGELDVRGLSQRVDRLIAAARARAAA